MAVEMKSCLILGSAPVENASYVREFLEEAPYVICADGGLDLARRCGIRPDLIVGDFDSLQGLILLRSPCGNIITKYRKGHDNFTLLLIKIKLLTWHF